MAPIPIINPTIGNGLGLGAVHLRKLQANDQASPPSVFGAGGFYTSSKSWGAGLGAKLFLKQDRFRVLGGTALGQANYDFYGRGTAEGDSGNPLHIRQKGNGFLTEGQFRVVEHWFVGLRYHWFRIRTALDLQSDSRIDIPEIELNTQIAGLALHIERDSRKNQFYPKQGSVFEVMTDFFDPAVASDFSYQQYHVSYQRYLTLRPSSVLAFRISGCGIGGRAPFFDLCTLGKSKDLRGYALGRYQDRRMLAGQAEYRQELPKRFAFVTFGGVGEVANQLDDFTVNDLKPGAGAGLRFRLTKENHINLRVNFAAMETAARRH